MDEPALPRAAAPPTTPGAMPPPPPMWPSVLGALAIAFACGGFLVLAGLAVVTAVGSLLPSQAPARFPTGEVAIATGFFVLCIWQLIAGVAVLGRRRAGIMLITSWGAVDAVAALAFIAWTAHESSDTGRSEAGRLAIYSLFLLVWPVVVLIVIVARRRDWLSVRT